MVIRIRGGSKGGCVGWHYYYYIIRVSTEVEVAFLSKPPNRIGYFFKKLFHIVIYRILRPGYDLKLHPAALPLLPSLGRSLRRSLAPLRYC